MSYQILLDLLYESEKYEQVLEAYKIIRDRQIEGIKFPKNVVVLTLAACYKLVGFLMSKIPVIFLFDLIC